MKVAPLPALPDLVLFEPRVFRDERGSFRELFHEARYREAGLDARFVQDNLSASSRDVLRGLHLQHPRAQGKLVSVLEGAVYDVAVDVRHGSPTFGRWAGVELTEANARQLWVPPGFAHGFLVLSERALFSYKCTELYSPADELAIRWDDPDLGIEWPVAAPRLSPKDAAGLRLAEIPPARLPSYGGDAGSIRSGSIREDAR